MSSGHRNLPLLLLQTREAAMGHFRPILKRFGLTDQQWRIARALREVSEGLPPGRIADVCKILPPSLTGILSRMEEMGIVARERSAVDQRRQSISLTRTGRALVDRVLPVVEKQYRLIERAIGAGALASAYRTLDTVLERLAQPIPSAIDGTTPPMPRARSGTRPPGARASRAEFRRGLRRKVAGDIA